MPISLKSRIKKFNYNGQITDEECQELLEKLKGHDKHLRNDVIDEFAHKLRETLNQEFPLNYESTRPFFTLENARIIVTKIAEQLKGE